MRLHRFIGDFDLRAGRIVVRDDSTGHGLTLSASRGL